LKKHILTGFTVNENFFMVNENFFMVNENFFTVNENINLDMVVAVFDKN
jgi:hypothetical protein